MKQPIGAVLVLGSLWMGWEAFKEWRLLNELGVIGELSAAFGGPSKEDAIVKGVVCVIALVIGVNFLGDDSGS